MKVALTGLMQSGKSTLLSAISGKAAAPMGATHIEEAVVPVPDARLDWLTDLYKPKKTVHATVDCLDVPGFTFLDESGRTAARRLIDKVRMVDMFVIVVRAFENDSVPAYRNTIDPGRDLSELLTEFLLADLEMVTTRVERLQKEVHKPSKTQARDKAELDLQLKLQDALENERPVRSVIEHEVELDLIRSLNFLTLKPFMVVVNVGEAALDKSYEFSGILNDDVEVVPLCASLEQELAQLDDESRSEFMKDLGIREPAVNRFVQSCYASLGLISFLTVGKDEVRAWPIRRNTTAHDAAGKIHSDIKRGFIRAETMGYEDLKALGDEKKVKEAGKMRLEGKSYIVQDGDIINFRFNV